MRPLHAGWPSHATQVSLDFHFARCTRVFMDGFQ